MICATGFRRGFEHDPLLAGLVAEHGLETEEGWIVLADDSTVPGLTDATRTLSLAGVPAQWAFPAADTLVGMKIAARSFRTRSSDVVHAERARRDAARGGAAPVPRRSRALPILHKWWPLELAGLMLAIGLALDVLLYHRLLPYQPGWVALPLGVLELAATMAAARLLELNAPLYPAVVFFAGAWLVLQVLAHAGLPLLRLTWPEDGGELGRLGVALARRAESRRSRSSAPLGPSKPPTVHLAAGVHQGPLVLDHAQTLIGERGAIVHGGIVITADDVTVRNVTVRGGENGIEVDGADSVELEDVVVEGAELDGINVRRSQVEIHDCTIRSLPRPTRRGSTSPSATISIRASSRGAR